MFSFILFEICQVVQDALEQSKTYHVVCVLELLLCYHENCKNQKAFVHPVDLVCNKNEEVFVPDVASSCIHAIDRSTIYHVVTIGNLYGAEFDFKAKGISLFRVEVKQPSEEYDND